MVSLRCLSGSHSVWDLRGARFCLFGGWEDRALRLANGLLLIDHHYACPAFSGGKILPDEQRCCCRLANTGLSAALRGVSYGLIRNEFCGCSPPWGVGH